MKRVFFAENIWYISYGNIEKNWPENFSEKGTLNKKEGGTPWKKSKIFPEIHARKNRDKGVK